ncbi:MAG: iron ABC transporter permease [Xanthomonadales bacterium]|nr:iron ABC transporter permease [Xanthomonadales bacterium]
MRWSRLAIWVPAALTAVPVLWLMSTWTSADAETWRHLWETQLVRLMLHTAILVIGVGFGTLVVGAACAWLSARCDYPGRGFFDWALALPLAIPPYVLAFVYSGALEYGAPLRAALRGFGGADPVWLSPHHPWMVVLILTLALYPYVYLLARSAFLRQGNAYWEMARSLGLSGRQAFWRVGLPLARPALAAGVLLAVIEALADFGAVSILGFDTFTTAIYKAWFSLFSLQTAAQLASLLLLIVLLLVVLERRQRRRAAYHSPRGAVTPHRHRLTGAAALLATLAQTLVLLAAIAYPVAQLVAWAVEIPPDLGALWPAARSSLILGALGAVLVMTVAIPLALVARRAGGWDRLAADFALLGYGLPGTVLAVALLGGLAVFGDGQLWALVARFGLFALLLAYLIRFLRVGWSAADPNVAQLRPSLLESAAALGCGPLGRTFRVVLPAVRPGLLAGLLLVAVEILKEMPATLMLRPFGWDTLAVKLYELTTEAEWERAAIPALFLVGLSVPLTVWLIRRGR